MILLWNRPHPLCFALLKMVCMRTKSLAFTHGAWGWNILHLSMGFLLASYKNTMNLISERREILYTISLVKETTIVWPSELVWILPAHRSIFNCQTAILSPAFDISILCDSIERELWGLRFNLKPVYCNKQMLWEPLIWISEGEMVEFEKTQRFSRNAISQENSLWWGEEDSGKGALVY